MAIEQRRRFHDREEGSLNFLLVDAFEGAVGADLYLVPSGLDPILPPSPRRASSPVPMEAIADCNRMQALFLYINPILFCVGKGVVRSFEAQPPAG